MLYCPEAILLNHAVDNLRMVDSPLVSIVIPTYNEDKYVSDLLKSIRAQTYKNYEVIVVDYNSSDKTKQIAGKYGAKFIHVNTRGISIAKNIGLKASKGDIVAFIDADYILSHTILSGVVHAFSDAKNKNIVAIEPTMRVNSRDLNRRQRSKFKVLSRLINVYKKMSYYTNVPAAYGCVFCKREALDKAGSFNENIYVSEDKEFFSRLRAHGRFIMIKDTARMSYRRHAKYGIIRTGALYFYSTILAFLTKRFDRHHVPVGRK